MFNLLLTALDPKAFDDGLRYVYLTADVQTAIR